MSKVRAIVFHAYGDPEKVAQLESCAIANPEHGEVLVRMLAAPINPADLNVLEGTYPLRPELPGIAGIEGLGEVVEVGPEVTDFNIGDRVLFPASYGTWREAGLLRAEDLILVPPEIAPEQAAMLRINPATAWRMLRDFADLQPGDWVLQNAANSGVGRAVIHLARAAGWKTLNVVRREELIGPLRREGADVVLVDGENLPEQIAERTGGALLSLALNAVGGDSASRLAKALGPGGTLVTYGAMSRQPLRIANGLLIFKDLRWRGFWVSQWYRSAAPEAIRALFSELFAHALAGRLQIPVERIYLLEEAEAALAHAARGERVGKILFGAPEIVTEFSRKNPVA